MKGGPEVEAQEREENTKKQTAARLAAEMVELAEQLSGKAKELIKEVEESRHEREGDTDARG